MSPNGLSLSVLSLAKDPLAGQARQKSFSSNPASESRRTAHLRQPVEKKGDVQTFLSESVVT
jgi:hypothetical protein